MQRNDDDDDDNDHNNNNNNNANNNNNNTVLHRLMRFRDTSSDMKQFTKITSAM